jgi:hypothetical protein
MSYSAGELRADRGVYKPLVARDQGVLLPLTSELAVAVKKTIHELPLPAALQQKGPPMRKAKDVNTAQPAGIDLNQSTLLKFLVCGVLVLLTADLQGQLLFKTKFSSAEGYTNGWIIGQPSIGNKWINANADFAWNAANDPNYGANNAMNNGCSWWPTQVQRPGWPGGPWYIATITNCTATGGALKIASDNNYGTNPATYFFKVDFPTQRAGPITATWDWQFHSTNQIPADYDPTNNAYNASLPGYDHGFTLSDYANCTADTASGTGVSGNPNWKYSELSTPFRLSTYQDGRHNIVGACDGGGSWNDYGPEFKDGKVLHMKLVAHVANAPTEIVNTYEAWCQRDGEDIWQTCFNVDTNVTWTKDGVPIDKGIFASGMRRCPDPASGINCLMLWMNGTQTTDRYVLVSNIVVLGRIPVLSIERSGANAIVTYSGTLQSCDTADGVYTDVVGQSANFMTALKTFVVTPTAKRQFYRAVN